MSCSLTHPKCHSSPTIKTSNKNDIYSVRQTSARIISRLKAILDLPNPSLQRDYCDFHEMVVSSRGWFPRMPSLDPQARNILSRSVVATTHLYLGVLSPQPIFDSLRFTTVNTSWTEPLSQHEIRPCPCLFPPTRQWESWCTPSLTPRPHYSK